MNNSLQEKTEEIARLSRLEKKNCEELRLEIEKNLRDHYEEEKEAYISHVRDDNRELKKEIEKLTSMNDREKLETYRKKYGFFRFRMFTAIKKLVDEQKQNGTVSFDNEFLDELEKYRTEEMTTLRFRNKLQSHQMEQDNRRV